MITLLIKLLLKAILVIFFFTRNITDKTSKRFWKAKPAINIFNLNLLTTFDSILFSEKFDVFLNTLVKVINEILINKWFSFVIISVFTTLERPMRVRILWSGFLLIRNRIVGFFQRILSIIDELSTFDFYTNLLEKYLNFISRCTRGYKKVRRLSL